MVQTGQPGGRQSLDIKRVHGPIHAAVPAVETAPQSDLDRNASHVAGGPNTNRTSHTPKPPEVQKDVPSPGAVEYAKPQHTTPNTNRNR